MLRCSWNASLTSHLYRKALRRKPTKEATEARPGLGKEIVGHPSSDFPASRFSEDYPCASEAQHTRFTQGASGPTDDAQAGREPHLKRCSSYISSTFDHRKTIPNHRFAGSFKASTTQGCRFWKSDSQCTKGNKFSMRTMMILIPCIWVCTFHDKRKVAAQRPCRTQRSVRLTLSMRM